MRPSDVRRLMKRPSGWPANPQALALVSRRVRFNGHEELGRDVDVDTWLTPRYILDHLGPFDLDPCAASENPNWVARRFFTKGNDGLSVGWSGRVFMNPPFSNTVPWLQKHSEYGNGISLVPATVESRVWRSHVWPKAKVILLLHGRTRFCNPDGSSTQGRPRRSIALIAWADEDARILEAAPFAGVVLKHWKQK